MHTAIIIFFGLILLALMLYIGERVGFSRQTLAYSFAALWLALTVINGAVGVVHAGQPLEIELSTRDDLGDADLTPGHALWLHPRKAHLFPQQAG